MDSYYIVDDDGSIWGGPTGNPLELKRCFSSSNVNHGFVVERACRFTMGHPYFCKYGRQLVEACERLPSALERAFPPKGPDYDPLRAKRLQFNRWIVSEMCRHTEELRLSSYRAMAKTTEYHKYKSMCADKGAEWWKVEDALDLAMTSDCGKNYLKQRSLYYMSNRMLRKVVEQIKNATSDKMLVE